MYLGEGEYSRRSFCELTKRLNPQVGSLPGRKLFTKNHSFNQLKFMRQFGSNNFLIIIYVRLVSVSIYF